jgi:hypothetical protein
VNRNPIDRADDERENSERDPLDQLLAAADWQSPNPLVLARLEARWKAHRSASRRRRWLFWAGAAAACLVLGVGLWGMRAGLLLRQPRVPVIAKDSHTEPASTEPQTPHTTDDPVKAPQDDDRAPPALVADNDQRSLSRPPNAYEALVFRAMTRRTRPKPVATTVVAEPSSLEQLLDRLAADPQTDAKADLAPLMADRKQLESDLVRIVQGASGPRREAAIRLLPKVAGRRCVPLLMELTASVATHAAAIETIAPLADSSTLGQLAAVEPWPALRARLTDELLARGDAEAVRGFLRLVAERTTREDAIAALKRAEKPPVDVLFSFLGGTQQSERLAAAVALGRLDGPVVTGRLIELAYSDASRQEALVALLASDGERASRFLNLAQQDSTLMAAVDAARYQLFQIAQ